MFSDRSVVGLLVAAALSGAALAQTQQPPQSGMPADPYARPKEMDPNEKAIDSASEQMQRGVRDAAARAVAEQARKGGRARPAKAAEIAAGAPVADKGGLPVGVIEAVESDGAVVKTATGKVKVPLEAFGVNRNGLLLAISKAEFDSMVAKATITPGG